MGFDGIKVGDVTLRNIQQQVEKNKNDIAAWTTLDAFGIKVLGIVATDADIPEGEYSYGDAYLVGTEEPYDLYVYTRGTENFVNIGPLTVVGPQGPTGAQGPAGTITIGTVTTGDPGSTASVINVGTEAAAILNIQIPRGATGAQGPIGETGPQGPTGATGATGSQGPQGDPGQSFLIIGTINNVSQLPDPTDSPRNEAYVYDDGDSSTPNRLYYITGTVGNEQWSYSPLAAAGTTVSVGGNPVSSYNATKVLKNNAIIDFNQLVANQYIDYNHPERSTTKITGPMVGGIDHKYYIRLNNPSNNQFVLTAVDTSDTRTDTSYYASVNEIKTLSNVKQFEIYATVADQNIKDCLIKDLTQEWGAGSEPDLATCQAIYSGIYAYESGKTCMLVADTNNNTCFVPKDELVGMRDVGTKVQAQRYMHDCTIFNSGSPQTTMLSLNLITSDSTTYNLAGLISAIRSQGSGTQRIQCSGCIYYNGGVYVCSYMVVTSSQAGWVGQSLSTGESYTFYTTDISLVSNDVVRPL